MRISVLLMVLGLSFTCFAQHPAYDIENIRPNAWDWPMGSMDFMSNGDLIVSSWKDPYEVHRVTNVLAGNAGNMQVITIASGLREMLGVKVVNDSIYVVQKDEITLLLDHNSDGKIDEFRCVSMDWTQTTNEKNYTFGVAYDGQNFYVAQNGDLIGSATLREPQPTGRINGVLKINRTTGELIRFAGGLRVPSGVGWGYGELWITENQGGYRPNDPLMNIREGRWYGRQTPSPNGFLQPYDKKPITAEGDYAPHAIGFEHSEFMRSPGTPTVVPTGPYAGHMLIPDASVAGDPGAGGVRRAFLEKIQGEYQGAAFRFIREGFEGGGVWDLKVGPDNNIYAGGNGSNGSSWGRDTHVGFDRLVLTGNVPFEMKAIRSLGQNSFEMEFTKQINSSAGSDLGNNLTITRYWDELRDDYGAGDKQDETNISVASAIVSSDQMKLVISSDGIQEGRTYYFNWAGFNSVEGPGGENMLYRDAWYTLINYGPGQDAVPILGCGNPGYSEYNAVRDGTDNTLCLTSTGEIPEQRKPALFEIINKGTHAELQLTRPDTYQFSVRDFQGRTLPVHFTSLEDKVRFDIHGLPSGLYIVTATRGGYSVSNKFIKFK